METSTALLVTTMIMALGAITFSALTMAFDRSHHRKSVRPFCNIHQTVTDTEIRIRIENAGMGPMLLQDILLLENYDAPVQSGVPLTKETFSKYNCEVCIQNTDKFVLASLSTLDLLCCTVDNSGRGDLSQLKEKLNGCCLYVKYADVYDDIYEAKATLTI